MPGKKLYAYSIQAGRDVFGKEHAVGTCRTTSKVKAAELAMAAALERYPPAQGWRFHSVKVALVRE